MAKKQTSDDYKKLCSYLFGFRFGKHSQGKGFPVNSEGDTADSGALLDLHLAYYKKQNGMVKDNKRWWTQTKANFYSEIGCVQRSTYKSKTEDHDADLLNNLLLEIMVESDIKIAFAIGLNSLFKKNKNPSHHFVPGTRVNVKEGGSTLCYHDGLALTHTHDDVCDLIFIKSPSLWLKVKPARQDKDGRDVVKREFTNRALSGMHVVSKKENFPLPIERLIVCLAGKGKASQWANGKQWRSQDLKSNHQNTIKLQNLYNYRRDDKRDFNELQSDKDDDKQETTIENDLVNYPLVRRHTVMEDIKGSTETDEDCHVHTSDCVTGDCHVEKICNCEERPGVEKPESCGETS